MCKKTNKRKTKWLYGDADSCNMVKRYLSVNPVFSYAVL